MEKFLEAAKIAWNPIGASREKTGNGTFTLVNMLVPYIGIVITCNLFAMGAQQFFNESLLYAVGGEMPDHPFLNNDFAQKFLSAFQVLIPLGAIALLPAGMFQPGTRNAVLATVLVVAAALAFYGAAMGVPVYVFMGLLIAGDPEFGIGILPIFIILMVIVQVFLVFFFWFRITGAVLGIGAGRSFVILLVGAIPLAVLAWLIISVLSASM